ncbi:hypothetical protein C0J52_08579 [Blattella germanica]|nr:hypothetical protein C0J52_08579 [Blattella germanica]
MATENQNVTRRSRRRRCDQTRSGQVVILVQIVSWCSVGALLVLRGITTLSSETEEPSMDNVTTPTIFGARNSSRDDQRANGISDPSIEKGAAEGDPFSQENATAAPNRVHKAPYKINPSSAILITVGTTMLVIGPTVVLARLLDSRRTDRDGVKFSKVRRQFCI